MRNHIKEILFALSDGGVEYIIGGGVAAVLHGVERVTLDIDIAVHMTPENIARLAEVTENLGLKPRVPIPVEALGDPELVRLMVEEKQALVYSLLDPDNPLRYLDVFLKEDLAYPRLQEGSVTLHVDGRDVRVVGRRTLLALKKNIQPPRDKDVLDIRQLEKMIDHEEA